MKVLMIGPSREGNGGMATVVNNYFESDLVKDIDLEYISSTIDGTLAKRLIYNFNSIMKITMNIIFKDYDIIHIHMASKGSFYRKSIIINIAKLMNKKVILHLHGACFKEFYEEMSNDTQKKYIRYILENVDKIIVLSEEWKKIISEWVENDISVLENAVFLPKENLYNYNSKKITMLGRLEKRKGTYDLLDIIEELKDDDRFKHITFSLAGDGDLAELQQFINNKNIGEKIEVLGWINSTQRDRLLRETMIYVLPSYNEGMPMSVLEAMSYGIPTISTYVGGIPRVIRDNENGFLIQPGDKNHLKENIINLIESEETRKKISNEAYREISLNFSIKSNIDKIKTIYESIVK